MKHRLTERQNAAYEFIRTFMRRNQQPPTLKEIGRGLGLRSSNAAFKAVRALEQKGYVERQPFKARGIRLVDAGVDPFAPDGGGAMLPVISRTASHRPADLRRRPSAYLSIDPYFLQDTDSDRCLIARAGDDGMTVDGIRKGDLLIVEEQPWIALRNGELAAVLIQDTLQVRRFFHLDGRIHLRPSDRSYVEEMHLPDTPQCYVLGRVVGLMRRH